MALREKVPTTEEESSATIVPNGHDEGDHAAAGPVDDYHQDDNLSMLQAATLLTADCLGVGILALPKDVQELGWVIGLGFLLINLPITYYSGKILHITATHVETQGDSDSNKDGVMRKVRSEFEMVATSDVDAAGHRSTAAEMVIGEVGDDNVGHVAQIVTRDNEKNDSLRDRSSFTKQQHADDANVGTLKDVPIEGSELNGGLGDDSGDGLHSENDKVSTHDFIGMTKALYPGRLPTQLVMALYFVNIFLVLGDYILVMSHAVDAMLGDKICLPWAGVLASILMFALAQLRTMSRLGREASIVSLACLFVVLAQCLVSAEEHAEPSTMARTSVVGDSVLLRKFSALASIGFAMGSQKLFLNIRYEMRHKEEATRTLICSLGAYGTAYILVVVLAGSDPPSFLFDAIPEGISRRTAGFLLWLHVSVSYAINSQAICSSLDRMLPFWSDRPAHKWMLLSSLLAFTSYTVANAVPFFQDLVSLIGALTSVPLALTLPAIFYRYAIQHVPMWRPAVGTSSSYSLLVYSMVFLVVGLAGALYSIDRDWVSQGKAFSCD